MSKFQEWKKELTGHKKVIFLAALFFMFVLLINFFASNYVDEIPTTPTSDLVLDHFGPHDWSYVYIYGFVLVLLVFVIHPVLFHVKELHIFLSQFSLLLLIRSFFISLTHLKVPIDVIAIKVPAIFSFMVAQNDLFFSGHTAFPFLAYLLFRKEKIGIFFLIATVVMATTVLVMHVHYSIDVFAALFITYGSYKIGKWFFNKIDLKFNDEKN